MAGTHEKYTGNSADNRVIPTVGTYWLTRVVFLRCLGFVYSVAFLVALHQNVALVGEGGLTPTCAALRSVMAATDEPWSWTGALRQTASAPTIFWFIGCSDELLTGVAAVGLALAAMVTIRGAANTPLMTAIWFLYLSLVTVGGRWYGFGWESQLCETGFLAIFAVPLLSLDPLPRGAPTPMVAVWGARWLSFRLMLGAGLIKIRGDQCWRDLTCMAYHYETQPVPGPVAWALHVVPPMLWHKVETMVNHIVELPAPFLLFAPRAWRLVGGIIQLGFQATLIVSGNLSFLNWLSMLPVIFCFDDASLEILFHRRTAARVAALEADEELPIMTRAGEDALSRKAGGQASDDDSGVGESDEEPDNVEDKHIGELSGPTLRRRRRPSGADTARSGAPRAAVSPAPAGASAQVRRSVRHIVSGLLAVFIVIQSGPVVANLLARRQAMNASFGSLTPWHMLNTYGAFGSVTKERTEVVLQGSLDGETWLEYEFPCKPTGIDRRPCVITPYHYRSKCAAPLRLLCEVLTSSCVRPQWTGSCGSRRSATTTSTPGLYIWLASF